MFHGWVSPKHDLFIFWIGLVQYYFISSSSKLQIRQSCEHFSIWVDCIINNLAFSFLLYQFSLFWWREQFLFSSDAAKEFKEDISKGNHELVLLYDFNLVDEIWKESRPTPPKEPIRLHDLKYAGVDVSSKLSSLRSELRHAGASAIVISMLDEIAWLLNLVILFTCSLKSFLLGQMCTNRSFLN